MDHTYFQEQISQFIDNELAEHDAPDLFAHLSACKVCREFLKESLQLRSRMTHSVGPTSPQSLHSLDWAVFANKEPHKHGHVSFNSSTQRNTAGPLPAIAFLLFMFVVGGLLFSTRIEIQRPSDYGGSTNPNVSQVRDFNR